MITDSFDPQSPAIINPSIVSNLPAFDACIVTFSHQIEDFVLTHYDCMKIAEFKFVTGVTPIYAINYNGKKFAFYKTYVGGPACVGSVEDALSKIKTNKYIVFGGAGCLNKEIARGKIMIPTAAYRDEGTSYHYMAPSDYVAIRNWKIVEQFMEKSKIPHISGKTWTIDSIYRETKNNFQKHKDDGCISVEMECASLQAMCNFRNLNLYMFFSSGDLLDAPKWDSRKYDDGTRGSQHDPLLFQIAIDLACYLSTLKTSHVDPK
jgi:purine-nucleoside phosphorylase